jgi:hypothetical protein
VNQDVNGFHHDKLDGFSLGRSGLVVSLAGGGGQLGSVPQPVIDR